MALGVRGINPIWTEVDLTGNLFDDTFYLFVLENTIPYIPVNVYHDPDLNITWTNPIQFLPNGTLPIDIYFESDVVYRLEFRKGPTQNDPLIYEVNNYVAGSGGSTPIDTLAFASSNQITNPQFALVSFASPYALTNVTDPSPVEVAPGWFLELSGTGNLTLNQVALNATTPNPSNAPYALRLTLNGWTNVNLRQRFQQNGMLWANKIVSSAITARIQGSPQSISASLIDSNLTTLAQVLAPTPLDSSFNQYTGYGQLGDSTNPNTPPAAYIDYKLALPVNADIYVTSFQLVVQDLPITPAFDQDSIDRQIDHTFHYYRTSLLRQPKESLLTGWDFGLNPWQFSPIASTTLASQCAYTADQTIIYQQTAASSVAIGQATAAENYAFEVKAITATNRFALIQYIDPRTMHDVWGTVVSSLVKANSSSPSHGSAIRFKMRLIWRTTLPSTLGAAEPISTWTGATDPTFSAGWTAITPKNDPVYTLATTSTPYAFEGMTLPAATSDVMTLGIVIYTLDNMVETATADRILCQRVSLCCNDFALDAQILTFDETLRRCEYYFEKSKNQGVLSNASGAESALMRRMNSPVIGNLNTYLLPSSFGVEYRSMKRGTPVFSFYDEGGTLNQVTGYTRKGASGQTSTGSIAAPSSIWTAANNGLKGIQYLSASNGPFLTVANTVTENTEAFISFHYTADARLGL